MFSPQECYHELKGLQVIPTTITLLDKGELAAKQLTIPLCLVQGSQRKNSKQTGQEVFTTSLIRKRVLRPLLLPSVVLRCDKTVSCTMSLCHSAIVLSSGKNAIINIYSLAKYLLIFL